LRIFTAENPSILLLIYYHPTGLYFLRPLPKEARLAGGAGYPQQKMDWYNKVRGRAKQSSLDNDGECVLPLFDDIPIEHSDFNPANVIHTYSQHISTTELTPLLSSPQTTVSLCNGLYITAYKNESGLDLELVLDMDGFDSCIASLPVGNAPDCYLEIVPPLNKNEFECRQYLPTTIDNLIAAGTLRSDGQYCVPLNTIPNFGTIQPSSCFTLMYPEIEYAECNGKTRITKDAFMRCVQLAAYIPVSEMKWSVFAFDGTPTTECINGSIEISYEITAE